MEMITALSLEGTLLFRDWREAQALWNRLVAMVAPRSLGLMPDHVHGGVDDGDALARFAEAMRAFALWRNAHRGESGPVWAGPAKLTPINGSKHESRVTRYIHLNPCREKLVGDPLAWDFSTHRDAVGLILDSSFPARRDPAAFHAYVSNDPAVHVGGTPLPSAPPVGEARKPASLDEVLAAVSATMRLLPEQVFQRGLARDLFLRAARHFTRARPAEIADFAGVSIVTVHRHPFVRDAALAVIERVLGDPRFPVLHDRDLRREPTWAKYRNRR